MEEITTRFEIIRLAVNLGDFRTIDLQCEKLRSLSMDDKLSEIIDLLESRNYRQALYEMKHYARSLEDEFFTSEKPAVERAPARQTPRNDAGLFDLGEEEEEDEEEQVLNLDDILRLSEAARKKPSEYRAAPEFEIEPESPASRSGESPEAVISEEVTEREEEPQGMSLADHLPEEGLREQPVEEPETPDAEELPQSTKASPDLPEREEAGPERAFREKPERTTAVSEASAYRPAARNGGSPKHPPISYISQKFRNMIHQFPPVDPEGALPPEVEEMQRKISQEGYTEEEIEAFLRRYQEYKEEGKRAEAAMVLLLAAATESKFAQFLLARELFRGEIIQQDHAEAFTQINTLADQNFAEAICDLGQFYEHGVGIGKDRQMALLLYEEAAEMGVARARKHYERLKNSRGLMGVFKKVSLPKISIPLPKKS